MAKILRFRSSFALITLLAALLAFAPAASADEASTIVHRCTHGESLEGFSQQAYRKALRELPSVISEYTDCSELIHKAQLSGSGHHDGGAGSTGGPSGSGPSASTNTPIPLSATEQRAVQSAHRAAGAPIAVGNRTITPGVMHANVASALNSLPTPLLATLAFLLAAAMTIAAGTLRNRVRTHRSG